MCRNMIIFLLFVSLILVICTASHPGPLNRNWFDLLSMDLMSVSPSQVRHGVLLLLYWSCPPPARTVTPSCPPRSDLPPVSVDFSLQLFWGNWAGTSETMRLDDSLID